MLRITQLVLWFINYYCSVTRERRNNHTIIDFVRVLRVCVSGTTIKQCFRSAPIMTALRLAIPDYTCSPVPPHTNVSMLIRALGTYIVQPLSLPAFIEPVYCTPTKYTPVQNTYFGDIKVDVLLNTSLGRPRFSLACYCNWRFFVSLQLGKASFPFWPDNPPLQ